MNRLLWVGLGLGISLLPLALLDRLYGLGSKMDGHNAGMMVLLFSAAPAGFFGGRLIFRGLSER